MPAARPAVDAAKTWVLGKPDLIVQVAGDLRAGVGPDRWGDIGLVPTGLTEDRYVSSVEVREVNDIPRNEGTKTVGGRYVFHHMTYGARCPSGAEARARWPIHEIGRNADQSSRPRPGACWRPTRSLDLNASHIHANGHDTKAHLEFGFKFFPKGYQPLYKPLAPAPRQRQRPRRQAEPGRPGDPRLRDAAPSTPRSSRSSRTCTRPACACASKPSGA